MDKATDHIFDWSWAVYKRERDALGSPIRDSVLKMQSTAWHDTALNGSDQYETNTGVSDTSEADFLTGDTI